ncbi:4463_t:CDS:2, partial [Cetraspora pellucida]
EADEQRFNEITSRLMKSNSGDKYKFQINNQFKASKTKIEKNNSKIRKIDKANDEPVNNFIERVSSNLTEDSLSSVNEILETNLSHPKIVDTETSVERSNRNDVLAISSIINGQESSTPPPNITKKNSSDVLMHYQNSSSTNIIEQSSNSFPTASTTDNTEFLHDNNRKRKQRMQYSLTKADLDEHESISSNSEEPQTSESGLLTSYLMRDKNEKYNQFLKNLLNDNQASHETPKFDESLMQRL